MKELTVVKIGGNIIDSKEKLHSFLQKFNAVEWPKILVHGGGKSASDISSRLGIEAKMVNGRRITDSQTLEIVVMVYSGINKSIAAQLNSMGAKAIGICGADMNMLPATKRKKGDIDYGFVGDITPDEIPVNTWQLLLDAGICPVVAPITADSSGQLLNTNADTVASFIAQALGKQYAIKLIYCFEKNGVLENPADEDSVIAKINEQEYEALKERKVISDGMLPKLDNAFEAMRKGVSKVIIGNALQMEQLTAINHQTGTLLTLE